VALRGNGCRLTADDERTTTLADRRSGTEANLIRSGTHIWLFSQRSAGVGETVEIFPPLLKSNIQDSGLSIPNY